MAKRRDSVTKAVRRIINGESRRIDGTRYTPQVKNPSKSQSGSEGRFLGRRGVRARARAARIAAAQQSANVQPNGGKITNSP